MVDGFTFDRSELRALAGALGDLPAEALPEVRAVVQKGSLRIKNQLIAEAQGVAHAPHFPRSITYDTELTAYGIVAEIGPDKDRTQGALGNLLYFGRVDTGPRLPDPAGALEAEAPLVEEYIAAAIARLL